MFLSTTSTTRFRTNNKEQTQGRKGIETYTRSPCLQRSFLDVVFVFSLSVYGVVPYKAGLSLSKTVPPHICHLKFSRVVIIRGSPSLVGPSWAELLRVNISETRVAVKMAITMKCHR